MHRYRTAHKNIPNFCSKHSFTNYFCLDQALPFVLTASLKLLNCLSVAVT